MKLVALADCCHIVSGATPKTGVAGYWDGDVDWVTPADLSKLDGPYIDETPRKITQAGLSSCAATLLPAGAVLLSSRAPIGHVAINTRPMATNQGFKALVPRADRVDPKYLYHWLIANVNYLQSLGNGATFKELSKATVSRVELPLPPLDEQRRIAAILDDADAVRVKRRQGLAHLDDLTQSIFLDMFGDTTTRPTVPLRSYTTLITKGTTPTSVGLAFSGSGIPFLRVQNLAGGTIRFSEGDLFIDQAAHTALRRSHIRRGDLLVSIAGTIGRCAIVPPDAADMNCNQAVAIVRLNDPSLGAWLMAWLSTSDAADQIKASSVTGTISNLSLGQLGSLLVPISDASRVAEFNQTLARAGRLRRYWEASAHTFEELFTTTQTHAFSGQL